MSNRYKVTAEPMKAPMYFQGNTEDEAWEKAKQLAKRNGMSLYNGVVEKVPTEAEKDMQLAALRSKLTTVTAEREAMREALSKLEFIYFAYKMTMVKRCPVCGSPEGDTEHSFDKDCWLAAALKGGKG